MRVAFFGAGNSVHTMRWVNGLVQRGLDIHLFTVHDTNEELDKRVSVHRLPFGAPLGYFLGVPYARKVLDRIRPDFVNAHYATGYGTLARLVGYKPILMSVWGSDVYDFPNKSPWHRKLVVSNLRAADAVASTSHAMAEVTRKLWKPKKMFITPFGIDEKLFSPKGQHDLETTRVTIGTVKTLAHKYGVDTLLEAFAIAKDLLLSEDESFDKRLRLLIVGGGPDEMKLKSLARNLGIEHYTEFRGRVSHDEVPNSLRELDIYVALSRLESFGVAILEASSCEIPVVVSDADGPREVTLDAVTGFVVPRNNPKEAAKAIVKLVLDPALRRRMGQAGRRHVLENYTWDGSLDTMLSVYREVASLNRGR